MFRLPKTPGSAKEAKLPLFFFLSFFPQAWELESGLGISDEGRRLLLRRKGKKTNSGQTFWFDGCG